MKRYLIIMMAALAALVSCVDQNLVPGDESEKKTPVIFNLTASHPDATKAVKSGWEAGDAIFVFFDNVAAPKHLKMSYDGSAWSSTEYDGATAMPGALELKNGDSGNMRAVFLPFGSDATVSADGTDFRFSKTYYAYYMTATLSYTVADNKVSGAFNMVIPDDYVQFFVEDAEATDEGYLLGTDAVIPVGVASIASDGTITETTDKTYVDDMPGYVYDNGTDPKGYIFTGKLNGSYAYSGDYYFSKTKSDETVRQDYFVTGKTLASHNAVKLPAANNVYAVVSGVPNGGKWVPVGSGVTVRLYASDMTTSFGTWNTCNYDSTKPEQVGTRLDYYSSIDAFGSLSFSPPNKVLFEKIGNSNNCSKTWLTVHGQEGMVFRSDFGFLFLPADENGAGHYWTSDRSDTVYGMYNWYFFFSSHGTDIQGNEIGCHSHLSQTTNDYNARHAVRLQPK